MDGGAELSSFRDAAITFENKTGRSTDLTERMGRRGKSVGVKTPKAADAVEGPGISVAEHGASAAEAYGFVGFVLTGAFRAPKPKLSPPKDALPNPTSVPRINSTRHR